MKHRLRQLLVLIAAATVLCGLLQTSSAGAHVLEQDNGVSAVLHIVPDDVAVAGRPTRLEFEFGGSHGSLDVSACKCNLTLKDNGRVVQKTALGSAGGSGGTASATVIFPQIGVYDLAVAGQATGDHATSFSLDFTVRVAESQAAAGNSTAGLEVILVSLTSFILLVLIAVRLLIDGGRYKRKSKK